MKIKDLPGSGSKFRASTGAGNFSKKFTSATRYGDLRNLADNRKSIIKAVKKSERVIKLGGFNRLRQIRAFKDIKKEEGERMTKDDKRDVKKKLIKILIKNIEIILKKKIRNILFNLFKTYKYDLYKN